MPRLIAGTPDKVPVGTGAGAASSKRRGDGAPLPPPSSSITTTTTTSDDDVHLRGGGDNNYDDAAADDDLLKQQQQQQREDEKMTNNVNNRAKKKLYDNVEQAPPPLPNNNNNNTTTTSHLLLLLPKSNNNSDNDDSTMIVSLLNNHETNNNHHHHHQQHAIVSSSLSWHEFGIFMQGGDGDGVHNNGDGGEDGKINDQGGSNNNNNNMDEDEIMLGDIQKKEERLLFDMVSNSIPKQQQHQEQELQQNNDNGNDNEVIVIEDSSSENSCHAATSTPSTRKQRKNNDVISAPAAVATAAAAAAVVVPPIIHTSSVVKTNMQQKNHNAVVIMDAQTRNSTCAAAAAIAARKRNPPKKRLLFDGNGNLLGCKGMDVAAAVTAAAAAAVSAPPIIHTSAHAKQTMQTKTNHHEGERSSSQLTNDDDDAVVIMDAQTRNPDGIVNNQQVHQPKNRLLFDGNGNALGYKGLEWDEKRGLWLPEGTAAQLQDISTQNPPAKTAVPNPLQVVDEGPKVLSDVIPHYTNNLTDLSSKSNEVPKTTVTLYNVATTQTANNVQTGPRTGRATYNNRATPTPAPPILAIPTNASGNNNDESAQGNTLPIQERWSEYKIDAAKSISELELIRHRLLTLLEKTNTRLKEMRVQRALGNELGVKGAENLSIKELIDMLSEQVEQSSGNVGEVFPTATTGKRNYSETEGHSRPKKRQRCCPLCLGTSHLQSETNSAIQGSATCGVCEDDGICFNCHSRCLKCLKVVCADCFAICSKCKSSACCSDCLDNANGKCATCCKSEERAQKRREKAAEKKRNEPPPPARALPIAVGQPNDDTLFEFKLPSPSRRTARGNESLAKLPPLVPVPTQITAKPSEANSKSSESYAEHSYAEHSYAEHSYAEHRFFISGNTEKIGLGLNIIRGRVTVVCVETNSLADKHGVQVGDELIMPGMVDVEVLDHFRVATSKPRPMIFHVKRFCSKLDKSTIHRFVVHEKGTLGLKIKNTGGTTVITHVFPGSLAEKYGMCVNDVLCKPFTNGSEIEGLYDWFLNMVKSRTRPFVIEVFRKKSKAPPPCYSFGDENPFLYRISDESSAVEANNGESSAVEASNENGNAAANIDENANAAPVPVYNLISSSSDESR
ncbi:hypothetical protein ACHAXM_009771 [Skeletonema potamos]